VPTLADLSLKRRLGAALNVLELYPSLDVPQRHELLACAIWPSPDVTVPAGSPAPEPRSHATPRERLVAVDMVVRLHMSTDEVASRYDVTERTVRRWISKANAD
jgi:Homeodomain-like domain